MADEKRIERTMLLEDLLKIPIDQTEDIRRIFLNELRMLYQPIESAIEIAVDLEENCVQDRERVFEIMKRNAQLISQYVDRVQSYLKARAEMKQADNNPSD